MITQRQVEAALCVWEHWLDQSIRTPALGRMFENQGSVEMRHASIIAGGWVDRTFEKWCALKEGNRDRLDCPFDWEIVPVMLMTLSYNISGVGILYPPDGHVFAALEALAEKLNPTPKPKRIRHLARGSDYTVLGTATVQISGGMMFKGNPNI